MEKKERIALISAYRERIGALEEDQDRLFKRACDQLEIDPDSNRGIKLFDFLFNGGFGDTKTPTQLEKVLWLPADTAANPRT